MESIFTNDVNLEARGIAVVQENLSLFVLVSVSGFSRQQSYGPELPVRSELHLTCM